MGYRGEVEQLVSTGCIARWADVADTSLYTKPHMVLPLGMEPKKPRLIWDARWLNLMCVHSPFTMDGVGKVAQCAWPGAHQVTIDHKSGYHHVALKPSSSWQSTLDSKGKTNSTCSRSYVLAGVPHRSSMLLF